METLPAIKKRARWIPVVTAIIRRENKLLLGQRPEGSSLPGVWEFPGGKIELGESPTQALTRELHEELNIEAEIGPLKYATTHTYGDTGIVLLFFEVLYWKGQPQATHHTELRWIEVSELKHLPLPEANAKVLEHLI